MAKSQSRKMKKTSFKEIGCEINCKEIFSRNQNK